jgi:hypothetical protein
VRQGCQEQPKQAKPEAKGKKIVGERYDPKILQLAYFAHLFGHLSASSSTGLLVSQMQWCPSLMMPTFPIWDSHQQIWVNYLPMIAWGWGHLTN